MNETGGPNFGKLSENLETPNKQKLFLNQRDVGTYHQTRNPDASQLWVDVVPHPNAATSDPLTHRQLQEEQGDADEEEENKVGYQVCT